MGLHLHLDPVGGVAGDMFVAALLDARPELAPAALAAVRAAGLREDVTLEHQPHHDGVLAGSRFVVRLAEPAAEADLHDHVHWRSLRQRLAGAALPPAVRDHALAIFGLLAEAEAAVHGVAPEAATFHEVGAWDSIADIVAAASLIEQLAAASWSISAVPLGSGRVRSAHGDLPVPAPATVRLLQGFPVLDDGRPGERVTPTGAAILRHLQPAFGLPQGRPWRLVASGYGFGQRRLAGLSNVLRVLHLQPAEAASQTDQVGVLRFEIDDQTAEDLALGLDRLRALPAVLDVLQLPAVGKRGRLVAAIQILTRPDALDAVAAACFHETTTLGLRCAIETRKVLPRRSVTTASGLAVKLAERPAAGLTAKAELAGLAGLDHGTGHAGRQAARAAAEQAALAAEIEDD